MAVVASSTTAAAAPARGTRPRNRQALIVAAASELFHRYGFAEVTMTMIADRVNVQPSALYRHFANKHSLLAEAIRVSLAPQTELLVDGADLSRTDLLARMAANSVEHREVGALWQREARALPATEFADVRAVLRGLAALLAGRLREDRPELSTAEADQLAWSLLSALASLAFHDVALPADAMQALLVDMLDRIASVELPVAGDQPVPLTPRLEMASRRERLLDVASRMFAAQGYAAVTVDAIGDAAGIAGPSVYNHFTSKQELLVAVVNRGNEWLWMEMSRAFAAGGDEADVMGRLLDTYLSLVVGRRELGNVVTGDLVHLPDDEQARARQSQHDYVREWVGLMCAAQPGVDAATARIRVQAAFMIINSTAQTPHLMAADGSLPRLRAVVAATIGLG